MTEEHAIRWMRGFDTGDVDVIREHEAVVREKALEQNRYDSGTSSIISTCSVAIIIFDHGMSTQC